MFAGIAGVQAQPGIYVNAGTNIFIGAGTVFSTDSLVLTPSTGFNIPGINAQIRTTTLVHPSANSAIKRVFHFSNTTTPFSGNIAIYYLDNELNGIPEANLTLNVNNDNNWNNFPVNVTRDPVNNSVTTTTLSNIALNELTLASFFAPLPVRFLSVKAVCKSNGMLISWQTAVEFNSKRFEVQESGNGISWKVKGIIAAAGITANARSYEYLDNTPLGNSWYRIVAFDADDRTTTSTVEKAFCTLTPALTLSPNPVTEHCYISIQSLTASPIVVKVYNAAGALLKSMQRSLSPGANLIMLDMHNLPGGWYTLAIQWNGNSRQINVLKQ